MLFNIITVFPKILQEYVKHSILDKFIKKFNINFNFIDLLKCGKRIDDSIFGGGKGLLLKPDILEQALNKIEKIGYLIHFSPKGKIISNNVINNIISENSTFTLICSRYEGIDSRIVTYYKPNEFSIGDYVLFDGDTAAMVFINLIIRYSYIDPLVIVQDSLYKNLIECDHYTKPYNWNCLTPPKILTKGNHKLIKLWREKSALYNTIKFRKDIYFKTTKKDYE